MESFYDPARPASEVDFNEGYQAAARKQSRSENGPPQPQRPAGP
jgi:hypothetical protein